MYQVIFTFENGATPVTATAAPGETLLETARAANVAIDAPCSGNGSCGKCRVKLLEGTVEGLQTSHITDEDYAAGWRLSCALKYQFGLDKKKEENKKENLKENDKGEKNEI